MNDKLKIEDLRIDAFGGSSAGWIPRPGVAIRITHLPSGVFVEESGDRSQHRNRAEAMRKISVVCDMAPDLFVASVRSSQDVSESDEKPRAEQVLRRLLAYQFAGSLLYADNGELQDNTAHPNIDFRRDSVDLIEEKIMKRALSTRQAPDTPATQTPPGFACPITFAALRAPVDGVQTSLPIPAARQVFLQLVKLTDPKMELSSKTISEGEGYIKSLIDSGIVFDKDMIKKVYEDRVNPPIPGVTYAKLRELLDYLYDNSRNK